MYNGIQILHNFTEDNGLGDTTGQRVACNPNVPITTQTPANTISLYQRSRRRQLPNKNMFSGHCIRMFQEVVLSTKDFALVLASVTSFWYREVQYDSGIASIAFTLVKHHLLCARTKIYLLDLSKMQKNSSNCIFLQSITQKSLDIFRGSCIA